MHFFDILFFENNFLECLFPFHSDSQFDSGFRFRRLYPFTFCLNHMNLADFPSQKKEAEHTLLYPALL